MGDKKIDPFILYRTYPNVQDMFVNKAGTVEEVKNDCVVVLDTNILLLPYTISNSSLQEIKSVYEFLAKDKRLFIPGQVAREFAKNRPLKLAELHQQLLNKKSKFTLKDSDNHPLLKSFLEYEQMLEIEDEMKELIKEYKGVLDELIKTIRSWNWDDPVSTLYSKIFTPDRIIDLELSKELEKTLTDDFSWRNSHNIPPGYKDNAKSNGGIGDYLIWKTILQLAKKTKKDVIFVTNDKKPDWYHRSNNIPLYPRHELVAEFSRETQGQILHIMPLSSFLTCFDVEATALSELENREKQDSEDTMVLDIKEISKVISHKWMQEEKNHRDYTRLISMVEEIIGEMTDWFLSEYETPANAVFYDGREGGYQYFNGEPCDPFDVLSSKYPQYPKIVINKATKRLRALYGEDWVRIGDY
ncbi:MAG: DUF4935 domain-containing protein [Bacteroidales bacterium]|nr:DUF4935 domain-containing protein [Bacteroidales bacterium]